jgi:hypothetical protein
MENLLNAEYISKTFETVIDGDVIRATKGRDVIEYKRYLNGFDPTYDIVINGYSWFRNIRIESRECDFVEFWFYMESLNHKKTSLDYDRRVAEAKKTVARLELG